MDHDVHNTLWQSFISAPRYHSTCSIKPKFQGSSFLVASPRHPHRHARHPCRDATRMLSVSGDFLTQLASVVRDTTINNETLPDWSAGSPLWCIVLPVCPCVILQIPQARHTRLIANKSLVSSYDMPDFLVTCKRHPCKDFMRMVVASIALL